MNVFKMTILLLISSLLLISPELQAKSDKASPSAMPPSYGPGTEIFKNPSVKGMAVDKCLYSRGERSCGKPAADRFCELKGYRESITFDLRSRQERTFMLGSEISCNSGDCEAFRAVACRGQLNSNTHPGEGVGVGVGNGVKGKLFATPRIRGSLVSYCLSRNQSCGKPAADAFCQLEGFQQAASFNRTNGNHGWMLKEQKFCNGNCDVLKNVDCSGGTEVAPKNVQNLVYTDPSYSGVRIDECLRDGKQCGRETADAYCAAKGHHSAISYSVGSVKERTWRIHEKSYCKDNRCSALKVVRCRNEAQNAPKPVQEVVYEKPSYRGARIDECLGDGRNCGREAANAYCVAKGHQSSVSYSVIRLKERTWRMHDKSYCKDSRCSALRNVRCAGTTSR